MEGINQEYLDNLKVEVHNKLEGVELYQYKGSVSKLLGLTVEVKLPGLKIGDLCYIEAANGEMVSSCEISISNGCLQNAFIGGLIGKVDFKTAVINGMNAQTGGLYIPTSFPILEQTFIDRYPEPSFREVAYTMAKPYV